MKSTESKGGPQVAQGVGGGEFIYVMYTTI
jgi:hypothetical protein